MLAGRSLIHRAIARTNSLAPIAAAWPNTAIIRVVVPRKLHGQNHADEEAAVGMIRKIKFTAVTADYGSRRA